MPRPDMSQQKHQLRQQMRRRLGAMHPSKRAAQSAAVCQGLAGQSVFHRADVMMAYLAMPEELSVDALIRTAWEEGKTVVVPKVVAGPGQMLAVQINDLDQGLRPSRFGIREPINDDPFIVDRIGLVLVPALAFDRQGRRLGRGGGYYDRFLATLPATAFRCGVAFADQLLDQLPQDPHDLNVEALAAGTELLQCRPARDQGRS